MGGCGSAMRMPNEKRFRRAIKLYEVAEVQSLTNLFNRNRCFETGDSPLTLATQQGHEVVVMALIAAGADVNRLDCNGRAAVHVASQFNDLQTLKILLSHKADPNRMSADGTTPLHIASERGFIDIIEALIESGADPNVSPQQQQSLAPSSFFRSTPLCKAVASGHVDCVAGLLRAGADPNVFDGSGQSPLRIAVRNGDVECVRLLVRHVWNDLDDLVDVAVQTDRLELVRVLLNCPAVTGSGSLGGGVGLEMDHHGSEQLLSGIQRPPHPHPDLSRKLSRPLIRATLKGCADMVDAMLAAGVDVNSADERGYTALHVAVMSVVDPHWRNVYSARRLNTVSTGRVASRQQRAAACNSSHTPSSCHGDGHVRCVMSLVQAGANVAAVWREFILSFPAAPPAGVTSTKSPPSLPSSSFASSPAAAANISFQQMVVCEVLTQAYGFADMSEELVSDFVCRLLSAHEFALVKLVYSAGVQPSRDHERLLVQATGGRPTPMLDYVRALRRNARTLHDLCRRQIRRNLSWNALYLIGQLDLEDAVKDYLCITDTDYYTPDPGVMAVAGIETR